MVDVHGLNISWRSAGVCFSRLVWEENCRLSKENGKHCSEWWGEGHSRQGEQGRVHSGHAGNHWDDPQPRRHHLCLHLHHSVRSTGTMTGSEILARKPGRSTGGSWEYRHCCDRVTRPEGTDSLQTQTIPASTWAVNMHVISIFPSRIQRNRSVSMHGSVHRTCSFRPNSVSNSKHTMMFLTNFWGDTFRFILYLKHCCLQ